MSALVKTKKSPKRRIILILLLTAISLLVLWEVLGNGFVFVRRDMEFAEKANILFNEADVTGVHAASQGFFIMDSGGGLSFYNTSGQRLFRHSHGIRDSSLFPNRDFVGVAARGGFVISVYGQSGLMYSALTDGPIKRLALGADGSAVVLAGFGGGSVSDYDIIFYDPGGNASNLGRYNDPNIIPVAVAISPKSDFIAISYADINNARLNSTIAFISTAASGDTSASGGTIAKNLNNPEQIIRYLFFMNDILLAMSDTRVFGVDAFTANFLWELPLDNRVIAFSFAEDAFAIAYGEPLLNRPSIRQESRQEQRGAIESGTVSIYNTKGEEILSLARESPSSISLGFGHIIIEDRHGIYCYNHSSVEAVWELKLPGNIMFLGFLGNHNRVLSVSPSTARIMERR